MDTAWVHQLSPFLIQFTDSFGIRYYGLAYILGFVLTFYFAYTLAQRGRLYFKAEEVHDLVMYLALGTMIGGRLGYVIFYRPELLFQIEFISLSDAFGFFPFNSKLPLPSVLAVHKGGMASHGGIIGIAVASVWFSVDKNKTTGIWRYSAWTLGLLYFIGASLKGIAHLFGKKNALPHLQFRFTPMHTIDVCMFGGPFAVFLGRIANFINGELYGREASLNFPWPVKFPSEIYTWYSNTNVAQLKALAPAVEALGPVRINGASEITATASLWNEWVTSMSSQSAHYIDFYKEALVNATQSGNHAVIAAIGPALTPRYPSQLIQALLEGLLVFLILMWVWRKPQKPGLLVAIFGLIYPLTRIIGEEYRLPDAHIGFQALGLTRGQWLSVGMMVVMALCLWYVAKSNSPKIGGWSSKYPIDTKQMKS